MTKPLVWEAVNPITSVVFGETFRSPVEDGWLILNRSIAGTAAAEDMIFVADADKEWTTPALEWEQLQLNPAFTSSFGAMFRARLLSGWLVGSALDDRLLSYFKDTDGSWLQDVQAGFGIIADQVAISGDQFKITPVISNPSALDLTFSVVGFLPAGLVIDDKTGVVSGTPTMAGSWPGLKIRLTDANGSVDSNVFAITIKAKPVISGVADQTVVKGESFAFAPAITNPDALPLNFSISSALPSGLVLDANTGNIAGTPTSAGSFGSLQLKADYGTGIVVSVAFVINVLDVPSVATIADQTVVVGESLSFTPVISNPGGLALSYSLPGGPSWMAVSGTGSIAGMATAVGTNTGVKLRISYSKSTIDSNGFNVQAKAAPTISPITNQVTTVGQAFSFVPAVSNPANLALTFSSVGTALPAGLTLNASTGTISGTPTTVSSISGCKLRVSYSHSFIESNAFMFQVSAAATGLNKLGTNVAPVADYSAQFVFKDLMKQSRDWVSGTNNVWDDGYAIPLDAQGYPLALRTGANAKTLMAWAVDGLYPPGTYALTFDGAGSFVKNEQDVAGIMCTMSSTSTSNHIRNAKLVMPGATNVDTAPFYQPFLDLLKGYGTLRFMDWGATNNSNVQHWNERIPVDYRTQAGVKGVAYEYMIQLCNTQNSDMWVCIPHKADDNFITQLATLVKNTLNPSLKCYFELSNEVWNSSFTQCNYFNNLGVAWGLTGTAFDIGRKAFSRRTVQMFNLIAAVYGAELSTRARRVMGGWTEVPSMCTTVLSFENAFQKTDIYAVAPYFYAEGATTAMTVDQILDLCQQPNKGYDLQRQKVLGIKSTLTAYPNVAMAFYEFGQSLTTFGANTALDNLYETANRNARMGAIYTAYLQQVWQGAAGGCVACHYYSCGPYNQFGSWGAVERLDQTATPKNQALKAYLP